MKKYRYRFESREKPKFTLLNFFGGAERPLYNTPELRDKKRLTNRDIETYIQQDIKELAQLESMGIKLDELYTFMHHLLNEGYTHPDMTLVDNQFQVYFNRKNIIEGRKGWFNWEEFGKCPVSTCGQWYDPNRDVLFHPAENANNPEVINQSLHHPPFRINDIVIHLAAAHGIWEKGEHAWDQCYPTSPLQFAKEVYLPWKEKQTIQQ
ncbi:MAG: hypothetical protein HYV32_04255 [Candidatus Kerfeldbacteria bacterium]|nr:hypothetical protein [Candidatus Kerfeldbacteria bacterium]